MGNQGQIDNSGQITNSGVFGGDGNVSGTGTYTQTAGTTVINGSLAQSAINIQGGGLMGSGSLTGTTTIGDGAALMPGNSPGHMTINGDLALLTGSTLEIEIGGLVPGSTYDTLDVTGQANLGGVLDVSLWDWTDNGVDDPFMPKEGDIFDILLAETVSGFFDDLLFPWLDSSLAWTIDYLTDFAGSTDVVRLSVVGAADPVPEPSTILLLGIGLLGVAGLGRRRTAGTGLRTF